MSPDLLNQPPPGHESLGINITLGNATIQLTPYNTLVRRFGLDNGAYDNSLVIHGGHLVEFGLSTELGERLESKGAPTTFQAIPDKVALSFYARALFGRLWQELE